MCALIRKANIAKTMHEEMENEEKENSRRDCKIGSDGEKQRERTKERKEGAQKQKCENKLRAYIHIWKLSHWCAYSFVRRFRIYGAFIVRLHISVLFIQLTVAHTQHNFSPALRLSIIYMGKNILYRMLWKKLTFFSHVSGVFLFSFLFQFGTA